MADVIVIGGGASGMAAAFSASKTHHVTLLERNEKLGKKIYITGKGRCNLTNACDTQDLIKNVVSNPRFLYSAFYAFTNEDVMAFFTDNGCPVKTERGNRVFPVSDHASDVTKAWERALLKNNADIRLRTGVKELLIKEGCVKGVITDKGEKLFADAVILCTGGLSYPSTGSTGDGYHIAEEWGHKVTPLYPSLVSLHTKELWPGTLSGLSLKNIGIRVFDKKKLLYEDFGELLFTHFGVSGPVILSASAHVTKFISEGTELSLFIDMKPALSPEELDARILRDFSEMPNKDLKNALIKLLPSKMILPVIQEAGISPEKPVHDITKEERRKITDVLKKLPLTLKGTGGFQEAVITKGGVSVKEIDPSTMESKIIKNLYFAGELLDVDAYTGGFNLQIAWSTGYLAGMLGGM